MTNRATSNRRSRRRRIAFGCLAAAAAGAGFIAVAAFLNEGGPTAVAAEDSDSQEGPPPAPVVVAKAVERLLAPLAEAPGSAVSISDSIVAAATTGKVIWVAEIGDDLEEGGVIARLDPADAELALRDARAEVAQLKARADYLKRLVARYEGLGEDTGEPEATLDEIRANYGEARGALERGRVTVRRAEVDLERTEIKAPFAGRVATREIEVGEFATIGAPVARFVDTTRLEVTARAPADMLANVAAGDEIAVLYQSEETAARVRTVVPVGDEVTRTLEVRVSLPETGWPIGAPVRVRLPSAAPRRAIAAPRDALVLRSDGAFLFKLNDEDAAVRVPVTLGAAEGDLIEIIGDVRAGERIIVRGAERLRDGQKVEIKEAPTVLNADAT